MTLSSMMANKARGVSVIVVRAAAIMDISIFISCRATRDETLWPGWDVYRYECIGSTKGSWSLVLYTASETDARDYVVAGTMSLLKNNVEFYGECIVGKKCGDDLVRVINGKCDIILLSGDLKSGFMACMPDDAPVSKAGRSAPDDSLPELDDIYAEWELKLITSIPGQAIVSEGRR